MYFFEFIQSVDNAVLDLIQQNIRCALLDFVMAFMSYAGESGLVWLVAAFAMLFSRKLRPVGAMMLCALTAGFLIGEIGLKNIICRERPFEACEAFTALIEPPSGYSFPSGHSCSSFAAAVVIFLNNKRLGAFALAFASLIAFSRLYNCVHYPSDVLCGILLGTLCAVTTVYVFGKFSWDKRLCKISEEKKANDND